MSEPSASAARVSPLSAVVWLVAGVLLVAGAWLVPVNLTSITPALLEAAGEGTPSVSEFGNRLLDAEKLGPAALVLTTAQAVGDPGAETLARRLEQASARQPELVPWGGWDPFLDPLFNLEANQGRTDSTPVLTFFIRSEAREALVRYLRNSRSGGVQALLATRQIDRTSRFVPALRPGGQPLDAVILLTALLYQGEHFSASLQRQLRDLAEQANARGEMGALESFYTDLLSLGRRLDWTQLDELMRRADSTETVAQFSHLGRVASNDLAIIYTAALLSDSADEVAAYLVRFGEAGLGDLRIALGYGRGAAQQLLARQAPVNREAGPGLGAAARLALVQPHLLLGLRYLGFFLGTFALFRAVDRGLVLRTGATVLPRVASGVLALLAAGLVIVATEPFLLRAEPLSEFRVKVVVPVLSSVTDSAPVEFIEPTLAMDSSTLISVGFFFALQVGMYTICLLKIAEISRSDLPALVKLKLMENEENLFDGGLYVGIGGTAAALVLQVLQVIEPNLLAAYSSNLFGITCVALVKIRHVRPYKNKLILEAQKMGTFAPVV